jgi:hypothetical protein
MISITTMSVFFHFIFAAAYAIVRGKVIVRYDLSSFDFIMRLKQLEHRVTRGFKAYLTTSNDNNICIAWSQHLNIRMPLIVTETFL